jgi:hypothetical protein
MHRIRLSRLPLIIGGLIIIGVIGGIVLALSQPPSVPDQPLTFSHNVHVRRDVQCLFCHTGVQRSPVAGIPSVQKCMDCHVVVAKGRQDIKELADYYARNEPIPWIPINRLPDFVYFSHQPHVNSGVSCNTCHGNVGKMQVTIPVVTMDMGWCLNCHLQQPPEKVDHLTDCLVCHK